MSSKTKIVVLKSKELIYTAIFVILGILLVSLLIYMFSPSKDNRKDKTDKEKTPEITETQKSQNGLPENNDNAGYKTAPDATVIPPQDAESVSSPAASPSTEISSEKGAENESKVTYKSGVYSSVMNVGGQTELQLSVTVDNGNVSHIDITNLNETVTAMYPLIEPSLDEINAQLETGASFENLTYSKENQYTTILIIQAAEDALSN
ncbi:MAG: hypothetical protein IJT72_05800 [Lachnospiraceae bacterium]|nr:hypothetical protein [Lachnospiraceae bacterium]